MWSKYTTGMALFDCTNDMAGEVSILCRCSGGSYPAAPRISESPIQGRCNSRHRPPVPPSHSERAGCSGPPASAGTSACEMQMRLREKRHSVFQPSQNLMYRFVRLAPRHLKAKRSNQMSQPVVASPCLNTGLIICLRVAGTDMYSPGQRFLQGFRRVLLTHAALPVFWAELGEEESEQPHHFLGLGVKANPEEEKRGSL